MFLHKCRSYGAIDGQDDFLLQKWRTSGAINKRRDFVLRKCRSYGAIDGHDDFLLQKYRTAGAIRIIFNDLFLKKKSAELPQNLSSPVGT